MKSGNRSPFEQALLDACLEEYAQIPPEEAIHRQETKPRRGRKTVRRLLLVAAILAMLATTVSAVPALRDGLIDFFYRNAGTHYEFYFDREKAANAPTTIEKVYRPTYIPEGFTANSETTHVGFVAMDWVAENGDYIVFDQDIIPADTEGPSLDAEAGEAEVRILNGYQVFYVRCDEYTMYHWTDCEYLFLLVVASPLSEDECNNIFYSITLDPTAEIIE